MLGTRLLRVVIGALFIGHGTQKLFGWFGGHGPDGTGQYFDSLGLKPGKQNAIAAGVAEAAGGALLAAGILTPAANAALAGVMTTATRTAHSGKGPWTTEGGWEYNAVLAAASFALTERDSGAAWAIASSAAGVAGAQLVLQLSGEPEKPTEGVVAETEQAQQADAETRVPASQT